MLNLEDVKKLALAAIASKPEGREYVYSNPNDTGYPECLNVHEVNGAKAPGCIVGNMLSQVVGVENVPISGRAVQCFRVLAITLTQQARVFVGMLQGNQDNLMTWGESYDLALAEVAGRGDELSDVAG